MCLTLIISLGLFKTSVQYSLCKNKVWEMQRENQIGLVVWLYLQESRLIHTLKYCPMSDPSLWCSSQNTTNHRKFVTNNVTCHDSVMYHQTRSIQCYGHISIYIEDNSMDCNYWKLLLVSRLETCREPISSDFNVYIAFQTSSKAVSSSAIS